MHSSARASQVPTTEQEQSRAPRRRLYNPARRSRPTPTQTDISIVTSTSHTHKYLIGGLKLLDEIVIEAASVAGKAVGQLVGVLDTGVLLGFVGGGVDTLTVLLAGPGAVGFADGFGSVTLEYDDVVVGDELGLGAGVGGHGLFVWKLFE